MNDLTTEKAGHRYGVSTTDRGLRISVDERYAVVVVAQPDGAPRVEHYLIHKELERAVSEDQIKYMVTRFLGWRLPDNFAPDGGVSFKRFWNEGTPHQGRHEPSGTNLLDADQAAAMVRHMIDGMPVA